MMEHWNNGKNYLDGEAAAPPYGRDRARPSSPSIPPFHYSNIPVFHYSNIPSHTEDHS